MPKRKSTTSSSFAGAETYDSDNGFVEDAPVGKKSRVQNGAGKEGGKNNKKANTKEEEEAGEEIPGGGLVGRDGECSWELTGKRRVGVSLFKGKQMVNIREYYEKDGETLPGKKGISLPVEQFNTLIKLLPHIETVLAEKGQSVARPDYSGVGASAAVDEEDEEEDEEMEKEGKKNFEATSDED